MEKGVHTTKLSRIHTARITTDTICLHGLVVSVLGVGVASQCHNMRLKYFFHIGLKPNSLHRRICPISFAPPAEQHSWNHDIPVRELSGAMDDKLERKVTLGLRSRTHNMCAILGHCAVTKNCLRQCQIRD